MFLDPSNMKSGQFLTMTIDLIMKFRIDQCLQRWFSIKISKILINHCKTLLLASRSHQKWITNVFLCRTNPNLLDWKVLRSFVSMFGHVFNILFFNFFLYNFVVVVPMFLKWHCQSQSDSGGRAKIGKKFQISIFWF